jgi:hypothetical protein
MAEPQELFKNFHKEESHSKHETKAEKGTKMENHKEIHIKIKFKPIFIERMIYSAVIIILLILLFLNPFEQLLAAGSNETNVVISDVDDAEDNSTDTTSDSTDTSDDTDTTDDTTDSTDTTETTTVTPDPEPELSGEVTFAIGIVELNEDKTRVESVTVSIDNQLKLFSPKVRIYFYDTGSIDSFKTDFNEISLPLLIAGKETTKKIERSSMDFSYLRTDDEDKETFKLELYDGNELLDTKTKIISTS